ncbi:carbonic anhydrase [Leptolyngbya sp. AN02str]|uniref:carbonic anhydrase n=1 Tax=Leptolyngbya sp. AN02str TaxID=3423363 RepID=UPI003D31ED29
MKHLIEGIRKFQKEFYCTHLDLYKELAKGQNPRVLFITCSDSRIDPSLLTQANPGEIFEIQNAGNIIPPYEATNGGEGATIEYAIDALGIRQIVICGHTHCGAMKGLLNMEKIEDELPLVHAWLKHAEATRRVIQEHYGHLEGEDKLKAAVAENVLTQIENLRTYPTIHSKLFKGELKIYAWVYDIDTGEVMAYDPEDHSYVPPQEMLPPEEQDPSLAATFAGCELPTADHSRQLKSRQGHSGASNPRDPAPGSVSTKTKEFMTAPLEAAIAQDRPVHASQRIPSMYMSPEQSDRIYRGSNGSKR